MNDKKPTCTICGGQHMNKNGFATQRTGKYQMYICNDCGHRQKGEWVQAVRV